MPKRFFWGLSDSHIVAALVATHLVLTLGSMRHTSLTWDEPSYIGVGRQLWETRNPQIVALQLHPPLSYYLNSIMLLPLQFDSDLFRDERYIHTEYIGPKLVFESNYRPELIIFLVRLPFVVLSAALGIIVYRWTKETYNADAALLALFFYAFCPTALAHCRLATADLLLALNSTFALYFLNRFLRKPSLCAMLLTGFALGFALLSKFTAIILIPVFLLIIVIVRWKATWEPVHSSVSKQHPARLLGIFAVAAAVVWAGYGFQLCIPFMPLWLEPRAEQLSGKPFWQAVQQLAERRIRVPAYSYLLGVYTQLAAAKSWKDNFLFGQISQSGWWYFYWVAFLIKTPLPLLICLLASVIARRKPLTDATGERVILLSSLVMILFFSLPTKINIGIRYILPLYPLFCILAARITAVANGKRRALLAAACVWYAVSAAWIYPNYLAYFNELAGGPRNGYKYLVDSNLDWGQKLKELAEYVESRNLADAKIKYFGPPGVMKYYGLANSPLDECRPSTGTWAISATYLQNVYLDDPNCHDWLKKLRPKEIIGYCIFIYEVSEEDIGLR